MSGLEKIISQIKEEAETSAQEKLAAAKTEADSIIAEAKRACEAISAELSEKTAEIKAGYESRAASSAEQLRKTALLRAKQEIIAEVIEDAQKMLKEEDAEAYFGMIEKLLKKYALAGDGEIYFSKRDLDRLPAGFEDKIRAAAAGKGGSLVLSKEPKDISDGFVLVYGGVEENCTLKALFEAKKDVLWDTANGILFA